MPVKSTVEISQNFVAFSEYTNFKNINGTLEIMIIIVRLVLRTTPRLHILGKYFALTGLDHPFHNIFMQFLQ